MKSYIKISGSGLSSKSTLRNVCQTNHCVVKELMFNNYIIEYPSKKEAVKALSNAYRYLKSNIEDWKNSCGSYQYAFVLHYDAGIAQIINDNE